MSENPGEVVAGTTGSEALPTPSFSSGSSAKPSTESLDLDALVEKLVEHPKVVPALQTRLQGLTDKRFTKLDQLGDVAPLIKFKGYLEKKGGNFDEAVRDYQIDQLLADRQVATNAPASDPGRSNAAISEQVQKRTAEILTEAGIEFSDPEYVELTKRSYAQPDDFYQTVSKFAIRRSKQAQTPGAAALAAGSGGAAPAASNTNKTDKLLARQTELSRKPLLTAAERTELAQVKNDLRAAIGGA